MSQSNQNNNSAEKENAELKVRLAAFEAKEKAEKEALEAEAKAKAEAKEVARINRGKVKSFALTRKCQVGGVLCDPKGHGAFIKKLPINQIEPCKACKGTGIDEVCHSCKDSSKPGSKFVQGEWIKCSTCFGTAKVKDQDCNKCKGTERSYPPHHYVEVDSDGDIIIEDADESAKMSDLREQIKDLDGDYDGRWGAVRLEQELIDLKKSKGEI